VAVRDFRTINAACEKIITNLTGTGIVASPNSEFILLAPFQLIERIARALAVANMGLSSTLPGVVYRVRPIYTQMLTSSTTYYIILPKQKMKAGLRQDLTILSNTDILAYADTVAGWMRHGGAIGDIRQISRCATA
jgi:hypothetical protein